MCTENCLILHVMTMQNNLCSTSVIIIVSLLQVVIHCMSYLYLYIIGDDRPSMPDLYIGVVCQYATQWEQLGLKLGLPNCKMANISENNSHLQAGQSVECCRAVLKEWLKLTPSPTWGKIHDAVKLLTVPVLPNLHKGIVQCSKILETLIHTMLFL